MEFSTGDNGQVKESSLPTHFEVSRKPKEYLKQGRVHCGPYSAKAILSAYGLDVHDDPRDFHVSRRGRALGYATPQMMVEILTQHGLPAERKAAKGLSDKENLDILRGEVAKDKPIALLVGNGHRKNGGYSEIGNNIALHWVTVWGYDDPNKTFFLYDSTIPLDRHDKNLPVGNVQRTYDEVLHDWKRGRWALPAIFDRYTYIAIKPESATLK